MKLVSLALIATGCATIDYNAAEEKAKHEEEPNTVVAQPAKTRDVVMLKNGSILKGESVEISDSTGVKIKLADGSIFVHSMNEVKRVTKDTLLATPNAEDEKKSFESWYTYWGLGYANIQSPTELQNVINALSSQSSSVTIGIDILGFYFPLEDQRTILGGIINGAAERYEVGGNYIQFNYYTYAFSAMHFLTQRTGDGFFVRGDVGVARAVFDSNLSGTASSEAGIGGMLGVGFGLPSFGLPSFGLPSFGLPIISGTRILFNLNYAIRRIEGQNYNALGITIGGLF